MSWYCHPELMLTISRCISSLRRQNFSVPEKRQRNQFAELYCLGVLFHRFYRKIVYQVRCLWAVKRNFYSCIEQVRFSCCVNGMFAMLLPPSRWYDVCITSHTNKPKNQLGEYHQLQRSSRLLAWRISGTADVIDCYPFALQKQC